MTREEAIEVYNGLINTRIKEAFEFFAPELCEINEEEIRINEEEIRKDIIGGLMWQRDNLKSEGPHDNNLILPGFCLSVGKHLAYLEKQKEQKPISFNESYNPDDYEVVMEGNATSLKQKKQKEEALRDFIDDFPYSDQKEQKPIEDVVKDITKNKESATRFLKSTGIMDDNGKLAEIYRLEQEPVVTHGETYHVDTLGTQQEIAGKMPQKPAEWSEEDKSFYDSIMCEVVKEGMHPTPEQANWFKSLPERFNLQSI